MIQLLSFYLNKVFLLQAVDLKSSDILNPPNIEVVSDVIFKLKIPNHLQFEIYS